MSADDQVQLLLTRVFASIQNAKAYEANGRKVDAVREYLDSLNNINRILTIERDPRKIALFTAQIDTIRGEINRIQNVVTSISSVSKTSSIPAAVAKTQVPTAAQADALLAAALELDEKNKSSSSPQSIQACSDAYIAAAECYLKLHNDSYKKRISNILDRVQALKLLINPESFTSSSDLTDELPEAPQFATATSTTAPTSKSLPNTSASLSAGTSDKKWVGAAKKLNIDAIVPTASDIANNSMGSLTQLEIEVLRVSSVVNSRVFQPWLPGEEERERFRYDHPFCDPDGLLPLSAKQISNGAEWRRPREFIGVHDTAAGADSEKNKPSMIELVSPLSIRQDLVSDCSFVCSLCIAAAFEVKFKKKLITSIIYPQNASNKPIYNAYGKYLVKLYINGVARKVVVDDRLPVSATTGELLCSASSNPRELWVSIIEKAYMKVNGGYDFPGSNSGIDLYALTGWIPEHVYFREDTSAMQQRISNQLESLSLDHRQSEDRAWDRIKSAHGFGDCLVTIATGQLTEADETATGLVPGHAYAVLDVKEAGTLRLMHVKNPWSRRPWKGRLSSTDRASWTKGLKTALGVADDDFDKMEKHGLFWIDFEDVRKYFRSFNLSWNPTLFSYRITYHDFWPVSLGPKNDRYYIGDNPQYCIVVDRSAAVSSSSSSSRGESLIPTSGTIWLLLTRHVTQTESKEKVQSAENRDNKDGDFLSLHVYRLRSMKRLYYNSLPSIKGLYTNDPHILVRVDTDSIPVASIESDSSVATENETVFSIVLSQIDKYRDVCYTLSVYSTVPFRFYPTVKPPEHKIELSGQWTELTCGGPPSSNQFHKNPQYRLIVGGHTPATVHIQILFSKDISAAIDLCRTGSRLDTINDGDLVVSSGSYRAGYCFVETVLQPGTYNVVLSTYATTMVGRFMCTVRSSIPSVGLAEMPPEGQPGYKMAIRGQWKQDDGTAAGCSNHGNYDKNPIYLITIPEASTLATARLTALSNCAGCSMNLSFFELTAVAVGSKLPPRANPKTAPHSSNKGVYTNRPTGVICDGITLGPGNWAMVPSTFDPEIGEFDIYISFSTKLKIPIQRIQ